MSKTEELWKNYLFLTKEIDKFLTQQDMDMLTELLDQRDKLQTMIEKETQESFAATEAGRQLFQQIQQLNQGITLRLQLLRNQTSQQHSASQAYDSLGQQMAGMRMDRQS